MPPTPNTGQYPGVVRRYVLVAVVGVTSFVLGRLSSELQLGQRNSTPPTACNCNCNFELKANPVELSSQRDPPAIHCPEPECQPCQQPVECPALEPVEEPLEPRVSRDSLEQILLGTGSDKASWHGYHRYYEQLFDPFRDKNVRLVEIGVMDGDSMKAWERYFTKAEQIYGVGFGNFQRDPKEKYSQLVTLYKGDQSNKEFISHLVKDTGGKFDIVIDDGSHVPSHQRISFELLWPEVIPGGLYIIEDVETSYWANTSEVYGYYLKGQTSIIDHFCEVPHTINREFSYKGDRMGRLFELPELYNDVATVSFGQNLIILEKTTEEHKRFLDRNYRFANKLP